MNHPEPEPEDHQRVSSVESPPENNAAGGTPSQVASPASPASPASRSGPLRRPIPGRYRRSAWSEILSRFVWLLGTAGVVLVIWKVGPRVVEEYHYSARLGQARAEYQNAVHLLQDEPLAKVSNAFKLIAQKVRPSVVSIGTRRPSDSTRGQGSGVLISNEGHVLTNSHVVENAAEVEVTLFDRRRYSATVIGIDVESDLAVVKIDAPGLIPATWGESDELEVGALVWAIGSPYGLDQSVTSGIISGKHRRDKQSRHYGELLQTDAAVNPGNSGGPLVDAFGDVIGINTSIFGESYQGISFAVPSETARFVSQQLIEHGEVTRGFLGVRQEAVFQGIAERFNLPNLDGAFIRSVDSRTPADHAGFQSRDVILEWDGKPITVPSMLSRYVEMTPPNSTVSVKIVRNGVEQFLRATVGTKSRFSRQYGRRKRQ